MAKTIETKLAATVNSHTMDRILKFRLVQVYGFPKVRAHTDVEIRTPAVSHNGKWDTSCCNNDEGVTREIYRKKNGSDSTER